MLTKALTTDARRTLFEARLTRRELLIWLAASLAVCQFARLFLGGALSAGEIASSVVSVSVICYLAWFAAFRLLSEADVAALAGARDIAFALALGALTIVASLLPSSGLAGAQWILVAVAALYCFVNFRDDPNIVRAATVLAALSGNGLWGPLFFHTFSDELLKADAALVGTALSFTHPEIVWQGTMIGKPNQHVIVVASACSSFHNISLALLCWVAVAYLVRGRLVRSDVYFGLAVCLAMLVLNAARIYLMALSYERYDYWHNGDGAQIFEFASTAVILAISVAGARQGPTRHA
ncbi:MAG: archaeosortase/exosortase family protein [Hyphomicrobium sp.]